MADTRKPYRVTNKYGQTFDLLLSDQDKEAKYPDAVAIKVGTPEVKTASKAPAKK